jgi:hypothetical protein
MERGSILRIEDARGSVLHVREGAVWLTQEGDPLDRYLGAGARFHLDRGGLAVAQAIHPNTTVSVVPPLRERAASFWTRLFPA